MNERIRELLYEAGGQYGGEHFTTGQTVIYTEEVDYEKFAELLIQECIIQCEREWIRHGAHSIHNQAIHGCINSIKKHFGVDV